MKRNDMLTTASLLSILFMTFHLTDDIIRGMASGGVSNLFGVLILVVWLYGTLVLAERRSGYVIVVQQPEHGKARRAGLARRAGIGSACRGASAADRKRPSRLYHPTHVFTDARVRSAARGVAARQGSRRASNSMSPHGKKKTLEGAGQRGMKAGAQAIFIQRFA